MDDAAPAMGGRASRFELAPPRRFILPAILLLLSERAGYGYGLVPALQEFGFGHVDRPAVYRALAQLEQDDLVTSSAANAKGGRTRRVYRVTPLGERVLRVWMGVIKDEHDHLERVVRRYQATGTADAMLAEAEGGWTALGAGWSPVSATSGGRWHLVPDGAVGQVADPGEDPARSGRCRSVPDDFHLVPDRSVVLVEVRSTAGPLSFGAVGLTGSVHASVAEGALRTDTPTTGRVEIDVTGLSSGNKVYDAELLRRIDARRFPTVTISLLECDPCGTENRYRLAGELTLHGVTRRAHGTVQVRAERDDRLVVTGEQVFDVRDFGIPSPTVLMLRIYPDVRVRLHAEAAREEVR